MKIIEAVERGQIAIPIADVLSAGGIPSFVEQTKGRGYFDIDFRGGELVLVAGNFIGQIPLTSDIAIQVKPKIPLSNLARMIGMANQPVRCLSYFRRKYLISGEAADTISEAIAQSLVNSLKDIDAEGIYRQYMKRTESLSAPRGRPRVGQYLRGNLAKAKPTAIPCTFRVLTADTAYNRIIKAAIGRMASTLTNFNKRPKELLLNLAYFYDLFESVSDRHDASLIEAVRSDLESSRFPSMREYYAQVIDISLLIMEGNGVELSNTRGNRSLHSLIVNLEEGFESYVLEVLRRSPLLAQADLDTRDGNKDGKKSLLSDNDAYTAKPDFVISRAGKCVLVGDAKYKVKIAEADRYQLISHAISYGVKGAFFVTPLAPDGIAGPTRVGEVGDSGLILFHYCIDLDSDNLADEEHKIADWLANSALVT